MNYDEWKSTDLADRDPYRDEPPPLIDADDEDDDDDPDYAHEGEPPPLITPAGGPSADPGPLTPGDDDPTA